MQYCYSKTAGRAGNLRFVPHGYVAEAGETIVQGDALPDIQTLHDPATVLSLAKKQALGNIDQTAGVIRSGYITTTPGQEATYYEKARQAALYQGAGYPEPPDPNLYPFVIAERTAMGGATTDEEAALAILAGADKWLKVGANIEQARRTAKIAIGAAQDAPAVATALQAGLAALHALANPAA